MRPEAEFPGKQYSGYSDRAFPSGIPQIQKSPGCSEEFQEQIEKKLAHYHISVDKIVHMSTPDYYYHLAKAGYLINDTTFPGRYIKKKGQIYLNVWHGTPLKRMGQDNEEERYDMGNIMRNLLMSDYLVFS